MKGMVIDVSIAASWLLRDEINPVAEETLQRMQSGVLAFVPSLWVLEITNLLFNAERRKRIDSRYRDEALEKITRLPLTILAAPPISDIKTLARLGAKHLLTIYDAEYLRVAIEQKLTLATLDNALLAAAGKEKVAVVS